MGAERFDDEITTISDHVEGCDCFLITTYVECRVFFAVPEDFDIGAMRKFGMLLFSEVFVVEIDLVASHQADHT